MSDAIRKIESIESELAELRELVPDRTPKPRLVGEWITEQLLSDISGYTKDQLESKRRRSKVVAGYHYTADPDGRIMWNRERFYAWVQGAKQPVFRSEKAPSESISNGKTKLSSRKCPTQTLPRE